MTKRRPLPNWLTATLEESLLDVDRAERYQQRALEHLERGDTFTTAIALAKLSTALSDIKAALSEARNMREAQ